MTKLHSLCDVRQGDCRLCNQNLRERVGEAQKIFEEIMTENFSNFFKFYENYTWSKNFKEPQPG